MFKIVKKSIRNVSFKVLKFIVPEIKYLKEVNFKDLACYEVNSKIGDHVKVATPYLVSQSFINRYTYIESNSKITHSEIGKFTSIGPNFLCGWGIHPTNGVSTAPMFYSTRKQNGVSLVTKDKVQERKRITIGNDVFIGSNVTVLDGVTIGDGAVIGAGAVVSKDIPPYAIAVGVPIKVIKYRFNEEQISALLRIKWWDFPEEDLRQVEEHFFDVDQFIEKFDK